MTKRWKMVLGALAMALVWVTSAWGDLAYERRPYPYGNPLLSDSGTGAVESAVMGGVMVLIALLPAIGAWLLMGVRVGKMPKWRVVLELVLVLWACSIGLLWFIVGMGGKLAQVTPAVWIALGSVVFASATLYEALRSKRRGWLVVAAVLAASSIVFLSCALYLPVPNARYTRKEWNDLQDKWEREHNEARPRMLEERRREWEWRHGNDILYGR